MMEARAECERMVDAARDQIFEAIANFQEHHHRLLPDRCVNFRVLAGGFGLGTEYAFDLVQRHAVTSHHFRVSEPIRGKVVTSFDTATRSLITWRIRELSRGCRVQIEIVWPTRNGWRWLAYDRFLRVYMFRKMLKQEMDKLEAIAPTINVPERPLDPELPRV